MYICIYILYDCCCGTASLYNFISPYEIASHRTTSHQMHYYGWIFRVIIVIITIKIIINNNKLR